VESPGRKELAQVQWLEHDLLAKVVSTFGVHALDTPNGVLILRGTGINGLRVAHIKEA
jgi:hypothetical protein